MRVLVTGSRYWDGSHSIYEALQKLPEDTTIIQGGCRGADEAAARIAYLLRYKVETYPADWEKYGKPAGNIRNQQMLDTGVDLVLAFHKNLSESKGTKDCVARAKKMGIEVRLFTA